MSLFKNIFSSSKKEEEKKEAAAVIGDTWMCMLLHETNVKTIVETVVSQHSAVSLLLGLLQSLEISTGVEGVKHSMDNLIKESTILIASIENTLTLQSNGLQKSLLKVQTSLKDFIIKIFGKEFEFNMISNSSIEIIHLNELPAKSDDSKLQTASKRPCLEKHTPSKRSMVISSSSKSVLQKSTNCNVDKELNDVETETKTIKKSFDTQEGKQSAARELEFKDNETNVDVCSYKKEIEQLREIIKQKEKVIDDQKCHISIHQAEIGALKDDISSQKGKIENYLRQIGDLKSDNNRHQTAIEELKCDKSNKKGKIEDLLQQIGELISDKERHQTEIDSLKNVSIYQDGEIAKLLRQIDGLEIDLSKLREQFKTIKAQKQELAVQIYRPGKTANLEKVIKDLHSMLSSNLENEGLMLKITECESISHVQADIPTLVVCVNASRLGTDVTSCLQGLTLSAKVLVVVLHHKDVHALPNQKSEKMLAGDIVRSVGSIIDMAFLSEKGLYLCTMNTEATSNIVKFLQTHRGGVI